MQLTQEHDVQAFLRKVKAQLSEEQLDEFRREAQQLPAGSHRWADLLQARGQSGAGRNGAGDGRAVA